MADFIISDSIVYVHDHPEIFLPEGILKSWNELTEEQQGNFVNYHSNVLMQSNLCPSDIIRQVITVDTFGVISYPNTPIMEFWSSAILGFSFRRDWIFTPVYNEGIPEPAGWAATTVIETLTQL